MFPRSAEVQSAAHFNHRFATQRDSGAFRRSGRFEVILPPDTRPVVPLHPVSEGSLAAEPSRKIVPTAML